MSFQSILGQEDAVERMRRALASGRLAHAYLFVGPDGVGKRLFARELTKTLMCDRSDTDACDECRSCQLVESGNHADVHWVEREEGKKLLSIDEIRKLQRTISRKAVEHKAKVFIVEEAHRMSQNAANCFLKTLEEPPPDSLLILIASTLDPLPETIVSRCHLVRFRPIPREIVQSYICEHGNVSREAAPEIAAMCEGSLGRAFALIEAEAHELRKWLRERLAGLDAEQSIDLARQMLDFVAGKAANTEARRRAVQQALDVLLTIYRDRFVLANADEPPMLYGLRAADASPPPPADLEETIGAVMEAKEAIEANASPLLTLQNMFINLAAT